MTKKTVEDFYKEIGTCLKAYDQVKYQEFSQIIKENSPKEVYLWLDKQLGERNISEEFKELLKDFFFNIH